MIVTNGFISGNEGLII